MDANRREILFGAGGFALGVAAGSSGLALVMPEDEKTGAAGPTPTPTESPGKAPEWPWPYEKLDVERTRKLGHQGYYEGACCYGAFKAIIVQLREKVGYPYTHMPIDMYRYGEGGGVGWSTLCGAINGAGGAITLVAGEDAYKSLVDELFGWYTEFEFPSDTANQYAKNHEFLVEEYKTDAVLPQSVSASPLCHVSVTKWCKESGYASGSSERSERCARLTGDVAAKTVELLNAHADGTFTPAFTPRAATEECRGCHFKGDNYEAGQFTRGKMNCNSCHEPHM